MKGAYRELTAPRIRRIPEGVWECRLSILGDNGSVGYGSTPGFAYDSWQRKFRASKGDANAIRRFLFGIRE